MSSTNAPFGLRPARHMSGQIRIETGTLVAATAGKIYKHSPVKLTTDGTIAVAAAGEAFVGTFMGCEYRDATGKPCFGHWPADANATDIVVYYTADPGIVYELQGSAAVTQSAVGNCVDFHTSGDDTGNDITGLSSAYADTSAPATATAQMQILGFAPGPFNAATDTYPILLVKVFEHQLTGPAVTAGV